MPFTEEQIADLILKSLSGNLTSAESDTLQAWISASPANQAQFLELTDPAILKNKLRNFAALQEGMITKTFVAPQHRTRSIRPVFFRYAAAAALVIVATIAYFWNPQKEKTIAPHVSKAIVAAGIHPGTNKATLRLSDGRMIELNPSVQQIIPEGNLSISNKNGALTYGRSDVVAFNAMTTPNGGQYRLVLPDGTSVWLNAASSITFPTAFPGAGRTVSITGEAYFEVTKDPARPFIVKTPYEEIEVLGTDFNVNAYQGEPAMKASLSQGAIRIHDQLLKPGEAYSAGRVSKTDLDQDLAWKNGVFNFNDQKLAQVMRQLSRWYDIEVLYETNVPDIEFDGQMSRNLPLSDVLEFLKGSKIEFRMEGKKLIVER